MIKDNVLQSLLLMKSQFSMIDSQLNNLITQTQNMGILPNTYMQINNISFQILNFGINMLNLGIQYTNPEMTSNLKGQIDNIINQLSIFSNNSTNNNMANIMNISNINDNNNSENNFKYNIRFDLINGSRNIIVCDGNKAIRDLIDEYFVKIGRNDLMGGKNNELIFLYDSKRIKTNSLELKVSDIFKYSYNPFITVVYEDVTN